MAELSLHSLQQTITNNFDADTVDGKHADGTPNNLVVTNAAGEIPSSNPATAKYIPTANIGGNIWIDNDSSNETYLYNVWKPNTAYALGYYVFATDTDGGYRYKCTQAGISGAVEPSWVDTNGQINNDNTVKWTCEKITKIPTSFAWNTWRANTTYIAGYVCLPMFPDGIYQYQCITGGVSGSSEPIWTTNANVLISDNTVQWKATPIVPDTTNSIKNFTSTHSNVWNDLLISGHYVMNEGKANAPEATNVYYVEVITDSSNTNYVLQRATQLNNVTLKVYIRAKINGTWGSWKQLYPTVLQ